MSLQRVAVDVSRDRCPFCHDPVSPEQPKTACDACMAWHHKDCWTSHGGCSACGEGAPTHVKPNSKQVEAETPELVPAQAANAPSQAGTWLAVAGFGVSLLNALFGGLLISSSYSAHERTDGVLFFTFTTPEGFDPIVIAITLVVTVPLLLLGVGLSLGGRLTRERHLANAGLVISALYATLLAFVSASAFS